jgi:SAM-dependent methyltransferase
MATSGGATDQDKSPATGPKDAAPVFLDARAEFAKRFLAGVGLEIGALHLPLATPAAAKVRYVDRMPVERLRAEYPELEGWDLTPVDVIDDGERLTTIPEGSQDFIVANHFLEHCEDPIRTIGTHLGKLRPGGVLFYAVPDKRYTFDHRRPVTPLEHMIEDHEQGPERSRSDHYAEWIRMVKDEPPQRAAELEREAYSIHMHVWTQAEFLRLVLHCRVRFGEAFDLEAAARQGIEFIVILRKAGTPRAGSPLRPARSGRRRLRHALGRALHRH